MKTTASLKQKEKGMLGKVTKLYASIRVPWFLYVFDLILSALATKVGLRYMAYEAELKTGNIEDPNVVKWFLICCVLMMVVQIASHIPSFYAEAILSRNMRNKLIDHSLHLPMRAYERSASQMVSWITQDSSSANGLISALVGFFTGIISVFMTMDSLSAIDKSMMILVPFVLVYIIFSTWLEGKAMYVRQRIGRQALGELTAFFAEHLGFFQQIKQLHTRREEQVRGNRAIDGYYKMEVRQALLTLAVNLVSGSLTNVIQILVFVMGVPMVRDGRIGMSELAAFLNYVLFAYQSLSCIPSVYTSFQYYKGELFYITNLMAEPEEVYQRQRSMDIPDQDIVFDNVTFAYDEKPVLENVTFTIPKGKVTMVAGPNGSGKSTAFKLLERFYSPDSGSIRFGRYQAEDIHLGEWRQSFSYVLQDPQLFNGTIRENIVYGLSRTATDAEVEKAVKLACAEEFIRELPGGYDFVIGDNGARLSGGQRQRIAIARALLLDPAYLLLDEATCNMDIYSEESVTNALLHLMEGRTTVVISHDMSMLDKADNVVVLNQGVVEASGPRADVERTSPTLQKLIAANA